MAASILTPPPLRALSGDRIPVTVQTDATISAPASIRLDITSSGPSASQTLRFRWLGNDLTFTTATTPDPIDPLSLPIKGGGTLAAFVANLAEKLAENEVIQGYFKVTIDGDAVVLTQRVRAVVDITVTSGLSNVVVTVADVIAVTTPVALRALLQVWNYSKEDISYEDKLLELHSPYNLVSADSEFDISDAFAELAPDLPNFDTIAFDTPPAFLPAGPAPRMAMRYYLRYADKGGVPAVAEALRRTAEEDYYLAILGSTAANSNWAENTFTRRNQALPGKTLVFPITCEQPDWVYVLAGETEATEVWVEILVRWSDHTTSVFNPFGTDPITPPDSLISWYPSGFKQMLLDTVTPTGSTDADASIIAYDWKLKSDVGILAVVKYEVSPIAEYDHYLMLSNGVGGLESVKMSGRATTKYESSGEIFQKVLADINEETRATDFGTLDIYNQRGRPVWELNTGWHSDYDYLVHLQQLLLGAVWLIDTTNLRFLKVIVDTRDIETAKDDETLFSFALTVKGAWYDTDFNQ